MVEGTNESQGPIFRDVRRYYCDYCGICRSKKALIASHVQTHHQEEVKELGDQSHSKELNVCDECGASFKKPAHLKQHMRSHSLERDFQCPVDDCQSSFRRKDHLTRHMLQHQGKLFECPVEDCQRRFTVQGNISRHVKEFHDESAASVRDEHQGELFECPVEDCKRIFTARANMYKHVKKFHDESASVGDKHLEEYACPEPGCGKVFKYLSKLRKHEDSHVKLDSVEAFCGEPECMKYFTNEKCLKEHILSCHQHVVCDKCGTKQLKKNINRHMRTHQAECSSDRLKCNIQGCSLTFSTSSNLKQHVKAVHLELKPYTCSVNGCQMKFAFKHVRDNHEKSGCHTYTVGDFEESDELFRSRPRGGRKRKLPVIESLMRKRVVPFSESDLELNEINDADDPSWRGNVSTQSEDYILANQTQS